MLAFSARISGIFWLTSIGRQYSNAADNRSIVVCICVFHPNDNRNLSTERSIPIRPNSPLHIFQEVWPCYKLGTWRFLGSFGWISVSHYCIHQGNHQPIISNACLPKRLQKSLHRFNFCTHSPL